MAPQATSAGCENIFFFVDAFSCKNGSHSVSFVVHRRSWNTRRCENHINLVAESRHQHKHTQITSFSAERANEKKNTNKRKKSWPMLRWRSQARENEKMTERCSVGCCQCGTQVDAPQFATLICLSRAFEFSIFGRSDSKSAFLFFSVGCIAR